MAGQMLGAMIAAMSVQWTVSRAVANGLITEHLPFARTSKGGLSLMSIEFQAFWEAVIGVLLLVGAARAGRHQQLQGSPRDLHLRRACWCWKACRSSRRSRSPSWRSSRINAFAFWRNSAVRTAELIGLRPVAMPTVVGTSQPVASEIHREAS